MFCTIVAAIETVYVNIAIWIPEIFPFQKRTPDLGSKGKFKKYFITENNQGFSSPATFLPPYGKVH